MSSLVKNILKVPHPEYHDPCHELPALQNTPAVTSAAGRSYRNQVVKDEVEADSSQ